MKKIKQVLYKYMSAERGKAVLDDLTIRFTQPKYLNDPYEAHIALDIQALKDDFIEKTRNNNSATNPEKIKKSADNNEVSLIEIALKSLNEIRDSLGILSLTEDPSNLLMWSHYGDSHKGIVIELNATHQSLLFPTDGGDKYNYISSVNYQDDKKLTIPTVEEIIDSLLRKNSAWKYEKEWRFIRTLNTLTKHDNDVYICKLNPIVIKRVILGANMSDKQEKAIVSLLENNEKYKHVEILKAKVSTTRYDIELLSLSDYATRMFHHAHHFGDIYKLVYDYLPFPQSDEATRCFRPVRLVRSILAALWQHPLAPRLRKPRKPI